ncbi:MAG TPA: aminotransferase class I/II-fold pyridoxal phosphate-dependent enzyme, partial [Rhodothermales bacterium]|nr:aminotransferase class I/II-fold pyridoxal phosphate-dependent enzyme [Rhodothermales bacterium]
AGGLCVSGGSMANLTALAVARHARLADDMTGAVIYYSDQTHSSIDRGLRVLGFAPEQIRRLPSDEHFRLDLHALREAVRSDRATGRVPFCVVANAATTNTGAVDPFVELADFCHAENLWLHADGAYGVAGVLCKQGRTALAGLDRVDSLSLDPHKWLFQPYEIGCVLVRDRRLLRDTFHILPEYLLDTQGPDEEVNFADYGIQLTRSFRALKLWLSFKIFGVAAFREAVAHGFRLAEVAEQTLTKMPDWVLTSPAQMSIVSFRYAPAEQSAAAQDALNVEIVERMSADGFAMLSTTVLRDQTVIRLCPINPRTTEDEVHTTLHRLDAFAHTLS